MATNHKHNTKSTHIKSDTSSKPQKSFVKKYPGFVVAVILAILVLIVFILYITSQPPAVQEQSAVAKNIFDNDQAVLDQYITNISAYSNGPFETTLEDDYYYSIMDDLNWLKKKEVEVFYSRPIEDVYIKEASFKYFMDKVVEANDYFTSGPEATNYSTIIAGAATVKPLSLNNFSDFDTAFYGSVDENTFNTIMLENDSTKAKFFTEFNLLFQNYYSEKEAFIQNSTSQERAYVEAKKLILLSYSAADNNASIEDGNFQISDENTLAN